MTPPATGAPPHLVDSLAKVAKQHRIARKLVVAPNVAAGRELLRRLALTHGGWIGFEVTTPRPLALRLARAAMERNVLSALDAFEEQSLLDRAMDSALVTVGESFGELSEGVGFRQRVHEAISAMRLAGIGQDQLERVRLADGRKRIFLLHVLQRYERLLTERGRADTATVLRLALEALDDAGGRLPATLDAEVVVLLPGLGTRGLTGRLVAALGARGAKVLETDPVFGLDQPGTVLWNRRKEPAPGSGLFASLAGRDGPNERASNETLDLEFFRAASIGDELRDVLRRVAERGLRWDQVEIVAADPAAYGSALHAIATCLGVPVTYAVGLPVERTRTGRVVRAYLEWIEQGFQAEPIRRLLEAGDLRPRSREAPHAAALARRFRSLRIGWGRIRYREQIREALAGLDQVEPGPRETAEIFERRRGRARAELRSIRSILFPALKATPGVPDRIGVGSDPVSPSELARGLRAFLRFVPKGRGPDRTARDDVGAILERVEAVLRRRTDFRSALAILRRHLDIRVRASRVGSDPDDRGAPWSSEGGSLHLTDMEHGGYTGREAIFFVGMDADRVPGAGGQDPVLLDADRRVLGGELPTSIELMHERTFRIAALFARLRGSVTMSYTAWSAADARTLGPSSVLLQGLRLSRGDPDLTFLDLEDALGGVVSAVPRAGSPALDAGDVWMAALAGGGVLKSGVGAVRRAFPRLDRGLAAHEVRLHGMPGPVHGVVEPRADELDPRRNPSIVLSASRLEALGACPLRYLHGSVLRIRPPDDPELDPDRWLDPLRRGGLLHEVYEATLRQARERGVRFEDPAFEALGLEVLGREIAQARYEVPVPGEGALRRETMALREDVRSFVRLVRERGAPWIDLELTFGLGHDQPVEIEVAGGPIRLRGAIDRVDEDLQGVRVIDYKTGAARNYSAGAGTFDQGRRLQHAIYARVAEALRGGIVVAGEYHHPTRRGENVVSVYDRLSLAGLDGLVGYMLDGVAGGNFVPTDEPKDCGFCDFSEICRAERGDWGKATSPLADWSSEHIATGLQPALASLRKVRSYEE